MICNPFTGQVINENPEGCNQHTGPNCGGQVRRGSTFSGKKTKETPIYEDVYRVALVDSNEDQLRLETLPSEEEGLKKAFELSKFYKLGVDKKRFKEAGYFKNRKGVKLYNVPDSIKLGEEESGEDFPTRTNLDSEHLQRMVDKIKSKRQS